MNKDKYELFCKNKLTYVPIYSQPWWMNAVCGADNWDVWIYEENENIFAVMPYYITSRGEYKVITKPALTQNNGVIINYPEGQGKIRKAEFENKICKKAIEYIETLGVDLYEQQYHYNFDNHLAFFWKYYSFIPRFTYVIEDTSDPEVIWNNYSSKYRNKIKKGEKNITKFDTISKERFWDEHEKVFLRQGLQCPFAKGLWFSLYETCSIHNCGEIITAQNEFGDVLSMAFVVWDDKSMYLLLGGANPEFSKLQTYDALIHHCIILAGNRGLMFDFEGSVIERINEAFRQFGGTPKLYYRIRKVFNPEIIRAEAEETIQRLQSKE